MIFVEVEDVVRFFRGLTVGNIALQTDAAIRDFRLHRDVDAVLPAGSIQCRRDVVQLDILFGHLLFIENHQIYPQSAESYTKFYFIRKYI